MNKRLLPLILIAILIGSCTPAPASPTPPKPATTTHTIALTETFIPTQTEIPTITPYPPLQTDGPYLLFSYANKDFTNTMFTVMDADGNGRIQFQLPDDGYVWKLKQAISPNGEWLAFFTGSEYESHDIALNLYNFENGISFKISDLIADNFPQNLEPAIEKLIFSGCTSDNDCKLSLFKTGFTEGLRSLGWSPDGKQLAFAAQIDGPSSDIYIFNIENKSIFRLTNELENIDNIIWSPDGQKVLYEVSIEGSTYFTSTIWRLAIATSMNNQSTKILSDEKPWRSLGWLNDNLHLISTAIDSPTYFDIGYIDINSEELRIIWPHSAESMILDSKNNRIILSFFSAEINNTRTTTGTYALYMDGTSTKISDNVYYLFSEQISSDSYLAMRDQDSLVSISPDGFISDLTQAADFHYVPRVSPDKKWLIIVRDNITRFFSKEMQLIDSWNIDTSNIIWRPDSKGAFIYNKSELYYISIPDGEPKRLDTCSISINDCYFLEYAWLP